MRSMRRREVRLAAHDKRDRDAVEQGCEEPRDERRHEQLGDVLLGRDGVDDEDDRGRDEDAERAADRDRAGGEARVVAVAPQLRQRCPSERGGGRDRGAADGAEGRAGGDHRHGQAAAEVADESARRPEEGGRQAPSAPPVRPSG